MNAAWVVPKGETRPMPLTAIAEATRAVRYHDEMADDTIMQARRRCHAWVPALMIIGAIVGLSGQSSSDFDSFDALYRRGAAVNAALQTLRARFTETTTSSLLTRPLEARGVVVVERPSKVILHYREPDVRDVLIDGDRMTMSWPARDIFEVTNIAATNRRIQRYFVDSSPDALRDSFDMVLRIDSERPGTHRLSMAPRRRQIREGLSDLDLWLDDTTLLLSAMRMSFPNGDTKLMELDDIEVNVPLAPETFSVAPGQAPGP